MSRFVVNESTCRRDGICAAVCPIGIIVPGGTSPPALAPGGEELCISCGHCVAACPYGACSLDSMASESCPPVRPEWQLSPEQAEHFLRSRRSIRVYKDAPVDPGRLERLIRVARHAPSGINAQPVLWLVISGHDAVRALAGHVVDWFRTLLERKPEMAQGMRLDRIVSAWEGGTDRVCRGAPHVVVVHAPAADLTAPSACTLALAYLELAAPSFGLGCCWAGYLHMAAMHWPPLKTALALPEKHQLCGAMLVGEPRYRYHRFPLRKDPEITWR